MSFSHASNSYYLLALYNKYGSTPGSVHLLTAESSSSLSNYGSKNTDSIPQNP